MCLIATSRARNNPKNELLVYKVLVIRDKWYTGPVSKYIYEFDKVLTDTGTETVIERPGEKIISGGYFHSFTNKTRAEDFANKLIKGIKNKNIRNIVVTIHKAIIPNKTKYYLGRDGDICSKAIKVFSNEESRFD